MYSGTYMLPKYVCIYRRMAMSLFKKLFGFEIAGDQRKDYIKFIFFIALVIIIGCFIGTFLCSSNIKSYLRELGKENKTAGFDREIFIGNLKHNIPNLGAVDINESGIGTIREVVIKNTGEVFYASDDGKNIFIGAWVDETGKNLTKEKMDKIAKVKFEEDIKQIDKTAAIKISEGKGTNEVIEFTDVDCPFCKRSESFFTAPDSDVTRYIFLTPLDSLHPEAAKKSVHILCSADRAAEYKKVIAGEVDKFTGCPEGEEMLKIHRSAGEKMGVQGTPQFYVNGAHYAGANPLVYEAIKKK